MITYPKINIKYEEINNFQITNETFLLCVEKEGVNFEFLMRIRQSSKKLLVFGSGAYNPEKLKPPIFQRHTWIDKFEDSIILYNDPTLYLGPISLGWGHGTTERFYLEELSEIVKTVMSRIQVAANNVVFYGSSGGGFMSMILAGYVQGSKALVNNPQTIVSNYYQSHVNRLLEFTHPHLSKEEILEQYKYRLDVIEFFKKINFVPNIIYIQNLACEHDMKKHVTPFVTNLEKLIDKMDNTTIKLEFYSDIEKGHNPLDFEETMSYFNEIL